MEEVQRCAAVFDRLDEASLATIISPEIRALVRSKNGALALSGAFVLFGCGPDHQAPLHFLKYRSWLGRCDYGLEHTDEIFGADVFGDLLLVRRGVVFRLDGETGQHIELDSLADFFERPLDDIAEELGAVLAREHFAYRVIGLDPLRLLPTIPFSLREHVQGEFFETPLGHALAIKHRLFIASRDLPNGARIDCSYWQAKSAAT